MRFVYALGVSLLAVGLGGCPDHKPASMPISEACEVIKRTLYPNCRLKFSSAEVDALSEENQKKISAVKLFFRQCPQAKSCVAK